MDSWLITLVVADAVFTLALLGLAKRMHSTRVASASFTFGVLFIILGAVTYGAMAHAGDFLATSLNLNTATKAEVTNALASLSAWRDFIWHTQVIIGAALIAHWVTE